MTTEPDIAGPDAELLDIASVRARMLASNMATSMTISLVNSGVVALLLVGSIGWAVMSAWFLAMAALAFVRRVYCRQLLQRKSPIASAQLHLLAAMSALAGIGWGVLPFLLHGDASPASFYIVIFMIAGMTAGASVSYASSVLIARAFNAPCLMLVGSYFILGGGVNNLAMMAVLIVYFTATDMLARRAKANLTAALENEARAERQRRQIEHQKQALEALAENYRLAALRAEEAESKLLHKSAELSLIFDNVPARIWFKDDQNNILRLNKPAAQSMGVTVEDAAGASTYDLFPEMAKKYHDDDLDVIHSGKPKLGIIEEYTPVNGGRGWVRTDKVPYTDPQTGNRYIFVVAIDITELREVQEDLQRANEELAQFARVASHDLQEPLKKLSNHGAKLKALARDVLADEAEDEINRMLEASEHMRGLVREVLNLARMPSSRLALQAVAPDECIEAAKYALGYGKDARNIEFILEQPPEVMAEPGLLMRIYQNLISNAVKFSAGRSQARIKFTYLVEDDEIVLGVKDNGVGLDPAQAERIFEPLARAHDRKQFDGTGIGLAICKKGVERMGGKIWVESAPGEGAHFKFRLRAARPTAAAA